MRRSACFWSRISRFGGCDTRVSFLLAHVIAISPRSRCIANQFDEPLSRNSPWADTSAIDACFFTDNQLGPFGGPPARTPALATPRARGGVGSNAFLNQ